MPLIESAFRDAQEKAIAAHNAALEPLDADNEAGVQAYDRALITAYLSHPDVLAAARVEAAAYKVAKQSANVILQAIGAKS